MISARTVNASSGTSEERTSASNSTSTVALSTLLMCRLNRELVSVKTSESRATFDWQ